MKVLGSVLVAAAAASIFISSTGPAQAAAQKSGTKGCSANSVGHVMSFSSGKTLVQPPQPSSATYTKLWSNGSTMLVRHTYASKTRGGNWFAGTNGAISDVTYATCEATGTSTLIGD